MRRSSEGVMSDTLEVGGGGRGLVGEDGTSRSIR